MSNIESFNSDASIEFVLVNGTLVVKDGKIVETTFPGRPILGKYRR